MWMYVTYSAHAFATGAALARRSGSMPLPRSVSLLGAVAASAGAGLTLAGMSPFAGPKQINGTQAGSMVASGAYRRSRNPQYTGYVLLLGGLALARRSSAALILAAGMATVFRRWVAVEESHLEETFGDAYHAYSARTPRWLGITAPPEEAPREERHGTVTDPQRAARLSQDLLNDGVMRDAWS